MSGRRNRKDIVRQADAALTTDERAELEALRTERSALEERLWRVEQVINANADLLAENLKEPQTLHPAATDPDYLASMGINTVPQYRHILTEAEQTAALDAAAREKLAPHDRDHDWYELEEG